MSDFVVGRCNVGENGETNDNRRVFDFFVIQSRFKIGEGCRTGRRIRHDLVSLIDELFLKQLSKHPPDTFHKGRIHSFIIILKINPSSQSLNRTLPFTGIPRDNRPTRRIVLVNTHFQYLIPMCNIECLINLIFHR